MVSSVFILMLFAIGKLSLILRMYHALRARASCIFCSIGIPQSDWPEEGISECFMSGCRNRASGHHWCYTSSSLPLCCHHIGQKKGIRQSVRICIHQHKTIHCIQYSLSVTGSLYFLWEVFQNLSRGNCLSQFHPSSLLKKKKKKLY